MNGVNVLVVDDEENVGIFTQEACEDWGYHCEYRLDSETAIQYFMSYPVHIVILDIDLKEEKSGIDLIQDFKEIRPEVIIIMLTGEEDIRVGIKAMAAGAFDYHLKPFDYGYMEQRLKQATERIKLERLKKIYLGAMVHDLKTPLQNFLFLFEIVKRSVQEYGAPDIQIFHDMAHKNYDQMNMMIRNILGVEKINFNKVINDLTVVDINQLITDQLAFFNLDKKSSPVEVKSEKIQEKISINEDLFLHVLTNLVTNARRFSAVNQIIEIELSVRDNFLETKVINRGSFIPENQREVIFDPFVQIGSKEKSKGNFGIGLAFCKSAVECMKGKIYVESFESPKKTIFIFNCMIGDRL